MSFRNFISELKAKREELELTREQDALRVAFDLLAQVKLRIQTRGEDFNEDTFSPYTPEYKKTRAKLGYQSEYVDLTRSGELWANVKPTVERRGADFVAIEIGAQTPGNEAKVRGFVRKRPNPIRPSLKEISRANIAYSQIRSNRLK